jgi:hypothetical protein
MNRTPRNIAHGIRVRAAGSWSPRPPPYLLAISERDFIRLREEWLKRVMMIGGLVPSRRVLAYFLAESLNWATMDCWPSHQTLADLARTSVKTVQRTTAQMEDKNLIAVYRRSGSSQPLRYAPVYLVGPTSDTGVRRTGQRCTPGSDTGVHESCLVIPFESTLEAGLPKKEESKGVSVQTHLSFNLAERGRLEPEVASLVGGIDVLLRLAAIHDDIVTRMCEAHLAGHLGDRQIKAAKLAAKQSQTGRGP